MSSSKKVVLGPRIEGKSGNLRYEFESFQHLLDCLEEGSLRVTTRVVKNRTYPRVKYGDREEGVCYVGLRQNNIQENFNKLSYQLLDLPYSMSGPRADEDRATKDIRQDVHSVLKFFEPYAKENAERNELKDRKEGEYSLCMHFPNDLKMPIIKGSKKVDYVKNGDEPAEKVETTTEFDLRALLDRPGKLMVKISSMWAMPQDKVGACLVGISFALQRMKYLTDAQRMALDTGSKPEKREAAVIMKIEPSAKKRKKITPPPQMEEEEVSDDE